MGNGRFHRTEETALTTRRYQRTIPRMERPDSCMAKVELGTTSGFYPKTTCRNDGRPHVLKPAIDRPSSNPGGRL